MSMYGEGRHSAVAVGNTNEDLVASFCNFFFIHSRAIHTETIAWTVFPAPVQWNHSPDTRMAITQAAKD